jgi:hypothetical protein
LKVKVSRCDRRGITRRAVANPLPNLLVKEVGDGIYRRFDQGDRATHERATAQGVSDAKGDGDVHDGEADGLGHGWILKMILTHSG